MKPLPLDLEEQAGFGLIVTGILALLAIAAAALSFFIAAVLLGSIALMAGLTAFIFWGMGRRFRKILAGYAAGRTLASWDYQPDQWAEHLQRRRRRMRGLLLVYPPLFAVAGLCVAFALIEDSLLVLESPAMTHVAGAVVGAALGTLVSLVFVAGGRYTRRRIGERQPRCVVGEEGFYLGGDFLPVADPWQRITGMALKTDRWPRIEMNVRTWTLNAAGYRTEVVPVPPGRGDEAREVIARLGFAPQPS